MTLARQSSCWRSTVRAPASDANANRGCCAGALARFLETARPTPASSGDKARTLSSLQETGEITNLHGQALHKLAALGRVLRSVYVIKVIAVPQAAIGLHARTVVPISEAALTLLNVDELLALAAHEIGHEYV